MFNDQQQIPTQDNPGAPMSGEIQSGIAPAVAQPQAAQSATAPTPAPAAAAEPTATPASTSKSPGLHHFISSVLGALSGTPPPQYTVDSTNGKLIASPAPPQTNGQKIKRLVGTALTGLSAGSQVPPQKSGLAAVAAGLGAGAGAVGQQNKEEDQANKKLANETFERDQQMKLRRMEIARANALQWTNHIHNIQSQNELDPQRAQNMSVAKDLEDAGVNVRYMTADEAKVASQEGGHDFITTHILLPLGFKPMTDSNGNPILDANGQPQSQGQIAVIDGMHDGKVPMPSAWADDVQKYGKLAGIKGYESIKEGDEYGMDQINVLHGKVLAAKKQALQGDVDAVDSFGGPDGKTPGRFNKITNEFKPNPAGVTSDKQLETLTKAKEVDANINSPAKTGAVTDADRYKEQQANYRAELGKQTAKSDSAGKAGATELQKQADDFSKFLFTANSAKSSILNAKNGDELANSLGPLQTALLVTSANGVHRINTTEVDAAGPKVGSLGRRVDAALAKAGTGKLPADTLKEMANLVDLYSKSKYNAYVKNAAYTAKLRGLDPETTPVFDKNGNVTNLGDALKSLPTDASIQVTDPQGGVHTFTDQKSADNFKKLAGIR